MLQIPTINTTTSSSEKEKQQQQGEENTTNITNATNATASSSSESIIICKGKLLMLYAGAGNKLVQRHLELVSGGKMRVFLEPNNLGDAGEPQSTISLSGCVLADYPENAVLGFALCRSSDGFNLQRLGQFIFVCYSVEDKRKWMWAIQQEIFALGGEDALVTNDAAAAAAKRSSFNKLRFNTESYVIDRGCRPPLARGFYLKRTGNFIQEYVVRWCELRDRVSDDNQTALGGIVYASYLAAPPTGWSFVPMRIDTKLQKSPEKNRVAVSGPNQEAFFIKFDCLEVMEEWYQNLEMLVERAKLENDPQFSMALKLNQNKNESWGTASKEQQEMVDQLAETRRLNPAELKKLMGQQGDLDWDDNENEDDATKYNNNNYNNNDNDDLDSETEFELEDLQSESPTRVNYTATLYSLKSNNPTHLEEQPMTVTAQRDSAKVVPQLQEIVSAPISRFRSDMSPYRPHDRRSKMYYDKEKELENKTGGGKQDNKDKFGNFSFASSSQLSSSDQPGTTSSINKNNNTTTRDRSPSPANNNTETAPPLRATTSSSSTRTSQERPADHQQNQQQEDLEEKFFNPENPSVEDVLERFDRHLIMARELLGPSPVLIRLRKELDEDSNDLKQVALYIINKFPRELKAVYLTQRIDGSLTDYSMTLRESVLVRIDMAKFREEFRLNASGVAVFTGSTGGGYSSPSGGSNWSFGDHLNNNSNTTAAIGASSFGSNNAGASVAAVVAAASPVIGNPSSLTAQFSRKKENPMSVDDALQVIERVTIEAANTSGKNNNNSSNSYHQHQRGNVKTSRSSQNAKIRDAIQFLQHFLSQFRENFDVFDDAGFMIDEVGGAIERGTNFLQEL